MEGLEQVQSRVSALPRGKSVSCWRRLVPISLIVLRRDGRIHGRHDTKPLLSMHPEHRSISSIIQLTGRARAYLFLLYVRAKLPTRLAEMSMILRLEHLINFSYIENLACATEKRLE